MEQRETYLEKHRRFNIKFPETRPIYYPNVDLTKPTTSKSVLKFDKMSPRRKKINQTISLTDIAEVNSSPGKRGIYISELPRDTRFICPRPSSGGPRNKYSPRAFEHNKTVLGKNMKVAKMYDSLCLQQKLDSL